MRSVLYEVRRVAPPMTVLLYGETGGTGKELWPRRCTTGAREGTAARARQLRGVDGTMIESELFGYEKGAFTGALGAKAGLLEAANGGTVFLDEVGDMPAAMQAKPVARHRGARGAADRRPQMPPYRCPLHLGDEQGSGRCRRQGAVPR